MQKDKFQTIKPKRIKHFKLLISLSFFSIFVIASMGIITRREEFFIAVAGVFLPIGYLLYHRLYFSNCLIRLDYSNEKLVIITPLSKKTFNIVNVYIKISRLGVRSTSYKIKIYNDSGRKIFCLNDSYWNNIRYIDTLPHKNDMIFREFGEKHKI